MYHIGKPTLANSPYNRKKYLFKKLILIQNNIKLPKGEMTHVFETGYFLCEILNRKCEENKVN